MPDERSLPVETLSRELRDEVIELVDHTELVDVRFARIVAELDDPARRPQDVSETSFDVELGFASEPGLFQNKFDVTFGLLDDERTGIGRVEMSVIVDYAVRSTDFKPTEEAAHFFVSTSGYLAAFPYIRELFQSLTSRLQLDPLVLGLLRRGTHEPRSIGAARSRALAPDEPDVD